MNKKKSPRELSRDLRQLDDELVAMERAAMMFLTSMREIRRLLPQMIAAVDLINEMQSAVVSELPPSETQH